MNRPVIITATFVLVAIGLILFFPGLFQSFFTSSPDRCENLQEARDACYNSIAQKNKDPNLCEKINLQSGDPKSDSRDNCYSNVAESLLNLDLCTKIQKVSGDGSRDTCYLNIATMTKKVEPCGKMTSQSTTNINGNQVYVNKDFCIQNVAMESHDASLCDQISVKTHKTTTPLNVSVQSCYAFIGQNSKNPSLCDMAGDLKAPCLEGAK